MIEDCRLIDTTLAPSVDARVRNARLAAAAEPLEFSAGQVIAFSRNAPVSSLDWADIDQADAVIVDTQWRRRTAGLKKLGQKSSRSLRVMWPANDRGRGPVAEMKSTLPLHILTGAVVAFGTGLVMAGVGSLVTHPELLPTVTAWFG
ncbi:hypothetical protein ACFOEZ_15695 [Tianweitania populi]|uniref:Uncharacterized protein n=1 Tax=Tianweitania populi TaxID=1607949 RepID=A0A8J3DQ18_9HYPH|nr:hypothetical protein [Tianweitania populi]GHD15929.1 hypothetical protein GCM10016234_23440 [Tianweitania populi]